MPIGAIITLCLFGAALIAFGIILAVMGGKPKFFAGKRFASTFNKLKTTLIVGNKTGMSISKESGEAMAHYCSLINDTVRSYFSDIASSRALKKTKHVIVQLMDNETYVNQGGKKHYEYYEKSAACIRLTRCWFWGEEIPTVCIRLFVQGPPLSKILDPRGEPVVHELCHAYLDDYSADKDDHADARVWINAGSENTIQALSRNAISRYNASRRGA
jgi:hypothetical protein